MHSDSTTTKIDAAELLRALRMIAAGHPNPRGIARTMLGKAGE